MNNPIGFFDSGVGGTSIWKEVTELLPNENTIYLADSLHAPYGVRDKKEIIALCEKNVEFLINNDAKIIVVACNTATTNAISHLRAKYKIPFIGIEPAIKPAGIVTKTRKIGVLATQGTLHSELFEQTAQLLDKDVQIIEQIGNGLVELIENDQIESSEMTQLLHSYLDPMMNIGIDALVLGCTHYPYLIPVIKRIVGSNIKIIDSGLAVAKQVERILIQHQLKTSSVNNATHLFYTNTKDTTLRHMVSDVKNKRIVIQEKDF